MTLATYDTDSAPAVTAAEPLSRAEERRRDKIAQAEIARQDRAARLEEQRQARADRLEEERQAKADRLAEKADRRAARAEMIAAAGEWASEHRNDLMLVPIVVVPALLSWSAMSSFGVALFAGIGRALPVLSEVGMWYFAFRVEDARKHGEKLFALYAGMVFCALICAALNLVHGLLGPIPGSIGPGPLTGTAYALIAVSGIIIHQLGTAASRHRPRPARKAPRPAARRPAAAEATWRATAGATAGAMTGATRQPVAPAEIRALPAAEGHGTGATGPETITRPETEKDADIIEFDPEELSRPGGTQRAMRRHWEMMTASGTVPTGADLNRAVGKDPKYSLGKRYAGEWRAEISGSAQSGDDSSGDGPASAQDGARHGQDAAGGQSRAQVARTRTEDEPGMGLAAGEGL